MRFEQRPSPRRRLRGVVLCLALMVLGASAAGQSAPADPRAVSLCGPASTQAMVEELVAEFSKEAGRASLDYHRVDLASAAAANLVGGRELMLTLGAVRAADLTYCRERWSALAPKEQELGAVALAIIVHPRNVAESLSAAQLRSIFSGEVKDWSVFEGRPRAIRRVGLMPGAPLTQMFHAKVLPASRCWSLARLETSEEIIKAVSGDPQAIAFADATAALSAGDAVRYCQELWMTESLSRGDVLDAVLESHSLNHLRQQRAAV